MRGIEKWKKKATECMKSITDKFESLGKILIDAETELSVSDYLILQAFLQNYGLTRADIEACKRVAQGSLDKRLIFSGIANSKVLYLSSDEQRRLAEGEAFPLKMANGDVKSKTWFQMTPTEKNQLLGPKGGGILPADEQKYKAKTGYNAGRVIIASEAKYSSDDAELELVAEGNRCRMDVRKLAQQLIRSGNVRKFMTDIYEVVEKHENQGVGVGNGRRKAS